MSSLSIPSVKGMRGEGRRGEERWEIGYRVWEMVDGLWEIGYGRWESEYGVWGMGD